MKQDNGINSQYPELTAFQIRTIAQFEDKIKQINKALALTEETPGVQTELERVMTDAFRQQMVRELISTKLTLKQIIQDPNGIIKKEDK